MNNENNDLINTQENNQTEQPEYMEPNELVESIRNNTEATNDTKKTKKSGKIFLIIVVIIIVLLLLFQYLIWPQIQAPIVKPVLYLYPTEETQVTVNFKNERLLETTYPKFKEEWNVTVKPDGSIYDNNGKYYYALYWDEMPTKEYKFTEGFYVTKDNAIEVLEETLSNIGLNDRESNEFIMYWLPILENNGKSIISYELTESKQLSNELIIEPTPDSLLRVTIHVKKVNNNPNLKEQVFEKFERKGFVAVEWGGQIHE